MTFASEVNAFVVRTDVKIGSIARKAELDMLGDVVLMTPVLTGRARGGWQFTTGGPALSEPGGVDPNGGQAIARATPLIMVAPVGGPDWFISNNVPYILMLEFGHSNQAPGGMARIAALRFQQNVDAAAKALGT